MLKAAVERKFEIIGEALTESRGCPRKRPRRSANIEKIIAFRNFVIHKYDVVSDPLVWDVIENKLPLLDRGRANGCEPSDSQSHLTELRPPIIADRRRLL